MRVLYRDRDLVAVHKPSGLAVHGGRGVRGRPTCVSLLEEMLGERPYLLHRLDRGTSGVLLLARNAAAASAVSRAFRERRVAKRYLAVVRGWPDPPYGKMVKGGELSCYSVLETTEVPVAVSRYPTSRYALVEVQPVGGRRHQVRRHLRGLSHPVVGDTTYGDAAHNRFFRERFGLRRLLLLAWSLELDHPREFRRLRLETDPDPELQQLFRELGWPPYATGMRGEEPNPAG